MKVMFAIFGTVGALLLLGAILSDDTDYYGTTATTMDSDTATAVAAWESVGPSDRARYCDAYRVLTYDQAMESLEEGSGSRSAALALYDLLERKC